MDVHERDWSIFFFLYRLISGFGIRVTVASQNELGSFLFSMSV